MIEDMFETKEIKDAIIRIIDSFDKNYGLGLGSQVSQLLAIYYLNRIDHYIKEVLHVKYYGRYMDDSYFILPTYEECEYVLEVLRHKYKDVHVTVNEKKTKIISLKHDSFVFLQKTFRLTESGKVLVEQNKKAAKRFRHKLKSFKTLYLADEIELTYIQDHVKNWICSNKKFFKKKYLQYNIDFVNNLYGAEIIDSSCIY